MHKLTLFEEDAAGSENPAWIEQARKLVAQPCRETACAPEHLLHLALNEAEALAWQTGFPRLVFPALAAEKIAAIHDWARKQEQVRLRGQSLSLAA